MAIVGAHMLLYTPEAEAVRNVLRDVFEWEYVEDHPGWLIFALPPAEVGVHPSEGSTQHQICLMCDDLESTMTELKEKGAEFSSGPDDHGYGVIAMVKVPGADDVQLYQPRHQTAYGL